MSRFGIEEKQKTTCIPGDSHRNTYVLDNRFQQTNDSNNDKSNALEMHFFQKNKNPAGDIPVLVRYANLQWPFSRKTVPAIVFRGRDMSSTYRLLCQTVMYREHEDDEEDSTTLRQLYMLLLFEQLLQVALEQSRAPHEGAQALIMGLCYDMVLHYGWYHSNERNVRLQEYV